MTSATPDKPEENPIEKIAASVYSPFAMLAGMQLDLFTALKERSLNAEQIAAKIGADSAKLKALLYALVVSGFLNVESEFFSNTDTAKRFLMRDSPSYVGDIHGQAYTEQEHKDWLEEAGFDDFRRTILDDGSSIITARKIMGV